MMELRDYQIEMLGRLRSAWAEGKRSVMVQMPTGTGKTVLLAEVIRQEILKIERLKIEKLKIGASQGAERKIEKLKIEASQGAERTSSPSMERASSSGQVG